MKSIVIVLFEHSKIETYNFWGIVQDGIRLLVIM